MRAKVVGLSSDDTEVTSDPLVRAGLPQATWVELKRQHASRLAEVGVLLGEDVLERIERSPVMSWVPYAHEAQLADVVLELFGPSGARSFYRDKTIHSFDLPLLREGAGTTMRLFGVSPLGIIKMAGRLWPLISQNAGRYECIDESGQGRGQVIMKGFPTSLYRHTAAWTESVLGGLQGLFQGFRMKVRVDVDAVSLHETRFSLHWQSDAVVASRPA